MSEFSTSPEDERLIAGLRAGLEQSDPVPWDVMTFAKAAIAWREIDAGLAEMEFDSIEEDMPAGVRSSATARMISFQAGQWMLDIEYDDHSGRLMGAISPETAYTVEVHSAGALFSTDSDDVGRFEAEGVTPGPLSLVLYFRGGQNIKTQWVIL